MKNMFIKILFSIFILTVNLYSENILFIGDSHSVGYFGKKFDELTRKDHKINIYAICGSTMKWWFEEKQTNCGYFFKDSNNKLDEGKTKKTPKITNLIKELNPDLIIVQLGTNYYNWKSEDIKKDIENFLNILKTEKCYWIGPPNSRKLKLVIPEINKTISDIVSKKCIYFDSTMVTNYPENGGDGIHFNKEMKDIADRWAESAYDFFYNQ